MISIGSVMRIRTSYRQLYYGEVHLVLRIGDPALMASAYINRIVTATPPFDINQKFLEFASSKLEKNSNAALFRRLAVRSQIDHRYSFIPPELSFGAGGFYEAGRFPDTTKRMRFFERHAPILAVQALDELGLMDRRDDITHVIVGCCTGFYAPGLDVEIVRHYRLKPAVERTIIGFMGCYSAISGLKLARHIVRSEPLAKVVIVNLEICTIHLREDMDLEHMLACLLWGDGCSAMLVSAEPEGIEIQGFRTAVIGDSADQMVWRLGRDGFDLSLSGQLAHTLSHSLPAAADAVLGGHKAADIDLWAVHPGGRSILDAVGAAFELPASALDFSRSVLRHFGNMSSATVAFVLRQMRDQNAKGRGCAMAFGPGVVAECMLFEAA